jgi:hypothetical protein
VDTNRRPSSAFLPDHARVQGLALGSPAGLESDIAAKEDLSGFTPRPLEGIPHCRVVSLNGWGLGEEAVSGAANVQRLPPCYVRGCGVQRTKSVPYSSCPAG